MEGNFSKLNSRFDFMVDSVSMLDKKIGTQGKRLSALERRITRLEGGDEDNIFEEEQSGAAARMGGRTKSLSSSGEPEKRSSGLSDRQIMEDRAYDRARASLKIFPVDGSDQEEMASNLVEFMARIL